MTVFGHERVVEALEAELPQVVLFRGPPSVGKWTVAEHLLQHYRVLSADARKFEQLDAEAAREIKAFCLTRPFGKRKVVLARLDGASDTAMNALLKVLEEPPPGIHFILTSVGRPLDTITSRSHVHQFGLLSREDLREVLMVRLGLNPQAADQAADVGRGQVAPALLADQQDLSRASVLAVVKAVADGNPELLAAATTGRKPDGNPKWDIPEEQLLIRLLVECITGRWQVFTEAESFGIGQTKDLPRRMLRALRHNSRPSLKVKSGMAPLLAARQR